ncbi:DNA-binding response regulator, partial [Streptomyces sp. NPDC005921]
MTDRGHDVVAGVGDADALVKTIADLDAQGAM